GLAVSPDGKLLYVADSENNRVRVIHLDQKNLVTTLAGQDAPGNQDGPLASARFNQPRAVAALPGDRLVVGDYGNQLLRLVDLKQGIVSTLGGGRFRRPRGRPGHGGFHGGNPGHGLYRRRRFPLLLPAGPRDFKKAGFKNRPRDFDSGQSERAPPPRGALRGREQALRRGPGHTPDFH